MKIDKQYMNCISNKQKESDKRLPEFNIKLQCKSISNIGTIYGINIKMVIMHISDTSLMLLVICTIHNRNAKW